MMRKPNPKAILCRWDKDTNQITVFDNGEAALTQFMKDFNIKTKAAAKCDLFDLLTDPKAYFVQNFHIAWACTVDLFDRLEAVQP